MDNQWRAEVGRLTKAEQWEVLYKRTMPDNNDSLWHSSLSKRGYSNLIEVLPKVLKMFNIKSFVDIGCSNRFWISTLDWDGIEYTGYDIVKGIVEANKKKYPQHNFACKNLIRDRCPKADMIFIRDVLIHCSLKECKRILENIKASGSIYMMASTRPDIKLNVESMCIWKKLRNLLIDPFDLVEPMFMIPEIKNWGGMTNDYMGIWEIDKLD